MAFSHEPHHKLHESQTYAKPSYNHSREPTIHYQNTQIYSNPTPQTNVQTSNISQNTSTVNQNNHLVHQTAGQTHGNQNIYNHTTMNQSAFGRFNFGITNNLNSLNFNTNPNLIYNRPQNPISREPLNSLINKSSNFDQSSTNKCWSVGKIPTRESMGIYGNQSQ